MDEYITELANDIAKSCPDLVENGCGNDNCVACLAFKLIGLGYKKQPNTADVVPKSEVAKIFEEIDLMCVDIFGNFNYRVFAELKKKYTEGKNG